MKKLLYRMRKEYLKDTNNQHMYHNYLGEIYEYYAYFELLNLLDPAIKIISKLKDAVRYGNFEYDKYGRILFCSREVELGEFDVLGYDNHSIYYFEITMTNKTHRDKLKRLKSKEIILTTAFPDKDINIIMVSPEKYSCYKQYETIIIPLPNLDDYWSSEDFKYCEPSRELYDLKCLSEMSKPYDYLNDIIDLSTNFYHKIDELPNNVIVERIYDLKSFAANKIHVYDIEKREFQVIKTYKKSVIKNKVRVKKYKKTYKEVLGLKKIMGGIKYELEIKD